MSDKIPNPGSPPADSPSNDEDGRISSFKSSDLLASWAADPSPADVVPPAVPTDVVQGQTQYATAAAPQKARSHRVQRMGISLPMEIQHPTGSREEAQTVFVLARGAVISLKNSVLVGQKLTLKNLKNGKTVGCQVLSIESGPKGTFQAEVVFAEMISDFWPVRFPDEDYQAAAPTPPPAPTQFSRPNQPFAPVALPPLSALGKPAADLSSQMISSQSPEQFSSPTVTTPRRRTDPQVEFGTTTPPKHRSDPKVELVPLAGSLMPETPFNQQPQKHRTDPTPKPISQAPTKHSSDPQVELVPLADSLVTGPAYDMPSGLPSLRATSSERSIASVPATRDFSTSTNRSYVTGVNRRPAPQRRTSTGPGSGPNVAKWMIGFVAVCLVFVVLGARSYWQRRSETLAQSESTPKVEMEAVTAPKAVRPQAVPPQETPAAPEVNLASSDEPVAAVIESHPATPPKSEPRIRTQAPGRHATAAVQQHATAPQPLEITSVKHATSVPQPPKPGTNNEDAPPAAALSGENSGIASGNPPNTLLAAISTPKLQAPAAQSVSRVNPPRLITKVSPVYPAIAKQNRVQGDVTIELEIDANGNVVLAKVASGPPFLQAAARDAVRKWKYEPATLNDKPVPYHIEVKIHFALQGS